MGDAKRLGTLEQRQDEAELREQEQLRNLSHQPRPRTKKTSLVSALAIIMAGACK